MKKHHKLSTLDSGQLFALIKRTPAAGLRLLFLDWQESNPSIGERSRLATHIGALDYLEDLAEDSPEHFFNLASCLSETRLHGHLYQEGKVRLLSQTMALLARIGEDEIALKGIALHVEAVFMICSHHGQEPYRLINMLRDVEPVETLSVATQDWLAERVCQVFYEFDDKAYLEGSATMYVEASIKRGAYIAAKAVMLFAGKTPFEFHDTFLEGELARETMAKLENRHLAVTAHKEPDTSESTTHESKGFIL